MGKVKLSRVCVLCKKDVNDTLKFGELMRTKLMRVHYYCLLLSETITQSGKDEEGILGFMASDIVKELNRTKNQKCCYCRESPATIGCANQFCNRKFHVHCGYENKAVFNFEKFNARCNLHTKSTNVPSHIKKSFYEYHCLICLETFDSATKMCSVIWADCCKSNVVLHSDCIRQMALSAGYFTKCPGCNNKTHFINTIKAWGVFVPERDASWELDRNAYSELLYVHSKCDQKICSCPNGREHSDNNGKWKILICKLCGSVGAHVACTELKRKFICDVCSMDSTALPPSLREQDVNTLEIENVVAPEEESNEEIVIDLTDFSDEEDFSSSLKNELKVVDNLDVKTHDNDIEQFNNNKNVPKKEKDTDIVNLDHTVLSPKKRPLEVIDNTNTIDEDVCKKLRRDIDNSELNNRVNAKDYTTISETIVLEEPTTQSYTVMLDDNNEVEFISCPEIPSLSNSEDVNLILDTVLSKTEENNDSYNKENEIQWKLSQSCDINNSFFPEYGNKAGKRVIELDFRNYTNHARLSL